jgi:hypothetical protein
VGGTPDAGDRFGASVAYGRGVECQESSAVAAGAPGEDVGGIADAGDVTIVSFADFGCRPRLLWAGHGLPGVRRRGAALGAAPAPAARRCPSRRGRGTGWSPPSPRPASPSD